MPEVGRRYGCSKAYFSTWRWPCQASASVLRTAGTYTAARSGDLKVSQCARFILFTLKAGSRDAMSLVVYAEALESRGLFRSEGKQKEKWSPEQIITRRLTAEYF